MKIFLLIIENILEILGFALVAYGTYCINTIAFIFVLGAICFLFAFDISRILKDDEE